MRHLKLLSLVVIFMAFTGSARASTYLQGSVTANGVAYSNYGSVSLSCNNGYSWASDWASVSSNGTYSMDTSNSSYSPCGTYYSGTTFTNCEVYAYPYWSDTNYATSDYYPVTLNCSSTITQDIALNVKDKTIAVTATVGGTSITSGITVYCSQQDKPYIYSSVSSATDGVYNIPVVAGTFSCSAYCSSYGSCNFSGNPSATVIVAENDTTKTASLAFTATDKEIEITVTAGGEPITSGISVSCNDWTNGVYQSTSTSDENGVYTLQVSTGSYYCSSSCNTWPCAYSGYPSTNVTVASNNDSSNPATGSLSYTVKNKILNVTIMAGSSAVTSGVTVYASEQGGSWSYSSVDYATNGKYVMQVGEAKYYVSAYCSNWGSNCDVAGYPYAYVTIEEDDESVDVTLTFLRNDATISGVVTVGGVGVANASVSVYSYKVSGGAAGVGWSISKSMSKSVVEGGSASTTSASGWSNTDANGAFQVKMPAGTYTVQVYPPWNGGSTSYGNASVEVTATANATTAVAIELPSKSATISGTVKDANGTGLASVNISGWSSSGLSGSYDSFWAQTDSNGAFSVSAIDGLKYNVSSYFWTSDSNNTICNYTNEGQQTVVASSTTAQVVNFTYPTCDCAVTMNAVDSNSDVISSIYGGVNASPSTTASGEYWYGMWGNLSGGTGTLKVQADTEYVFSPYIWDSSYVQGDDVTSTCTDGAVTVNFTMLPLDASISGSYAGSDGSAIDLTQYTYLNVYATKGKAYRSCTTSASGYSCQLSAGEWCLGYWIDQSSGYASSAPGAAASCVTLTSGSSSTQNITLLQTGTIDVTALGADGNGRYNVWIEATPYSNQDKGANDYQHMYMSNGCMTSTDGTCSINVGAASGSGTVYYLNAYIPYSMKEDENLMNPSEVSVTVVAGESVTADTLTFKQPDGTSVITVAEGSTSASIVLGKGLSKSVVNADESAAASSTANATVDCFSPSGGSFQAETDESGVATCPCTTTDTWKAVAHNMVANNLWMSEATDITCLAEGGIGSVTMSNVATVPEGKSVTIDDASTQTLTMTLSDGFSVFFPMGSLGDSGEQVTCTVDVTVTPFTSNRRPASFYGYSVNCQDGNGSAIIQLNSNATFTLPINATQVANLGLTAEDIEASYFDTSTGAYSPITSAVINDAGGVVTYQQNHLTDFSIVGNGNLAGISGEEAGDGANEYGDDGTVASASGSSGCGCNVGSNPSIADKLAFPIALLILLGFIYGSKLCYKRAKKR